MFKCAGSPYLEERTYEEHQKGIGKLRRLWWKIWEASKTMVEDLLEGNGRIWQVYQIIYQVIK